MLRLLAIGLLIAIVVFIATAGHVIFLPLLLVPVGLLFGGRRSRRRTF
jgi:hypothetical protein